MFERDSLGALGVSLVIRVHQQTEARAVRVQYQSRVLGTLEAAEFR